MTFTPPSARISGSGTSAARPGSATFGSCGASRARRVAPRARARARPAAPRPAPDVTASTRARPRRPSSPRGARTDRSRRSTRRASLRTARRSTRDLDDAHDVAVLLAEEHRGAELPGLVDRRLEDVHRAVLEHDLVDAPLDRVALLGERTVVGEVEAELVRPHRRSGLPHVIAEDLAERLVQEVRARVVRHRRKADADGTRARTRSPAANPEPRNRRAWSPSSRYASTSSAVVLVPSSSSIVPASVTWPPPAG